MAFGGKDVSSEQVSKYIRGGVHEVTIKGVKGEVNQNGTPMILIEMYLRSADSTASSTFRFPMSPNAEDSSLKKIRHIVTKVAKDEAYLNAKGDSVEEYGESLNEILAGQSLRMKFTSEEYLKQDQTVGVRANIGLPNFAEAIQEGAEKPVVSEADSKLVYSVNNKYDYKKLTVVPDNSIAGDFSQEKAANDLLF